MAILAGDASLGSRAVLSRLREPNRRPAGESRERSTRVHAAAFARSSCCRTLWELGRLQSAGSSIRSSTGTRTNSSRAPLSSIRVSRCVSCRLRSSDSSRPVRRRTSLTATSLKPGFLCQDTPERLRDGMSVKLTSRASWAAAQSKRQTRRRAGAAEATGVEARVVGIPLPLRRQTADNARELVAAADRRPGRTL